MSPSDISSRLRAVAERLDVSRRPSVSLVSSELRGILAAVEPTKAYRIVTDEPLGIAVGFVPEGAEYYDEFDVTSDDGGGFVFISPDATSLFISKERHHPGQNPEWPEPDLLVFRSPDDWESWKAENEE